MWKRLKRELLFEYYWYRRHFKVLRQLESPLGFFGAVFVISSIFLLVIIGQAFAAIFRNMIPVVKGSDIAGVYWTSIILAIKFTIVLLIFIVSLIIVLFIKFSRKR
ncbi:hypothetical protein Sgly_0230 [Syntrophobotulus glycolicus DSM 8271]|uniref:Uncharacterized protein n=1 Tax=Syntrophobotulus glycolicus (strain DSM 8271 / FlGlyR) TaxID=645991 RepID=F0SWB5_SYNGF|nr:hypothetical protein Sgly_0230 [Syntrophobotulus glycolicus DSM 8271]